MFLEIKQITTQSGHGQAAAERFFNGGLVKTQPGFVRLEAGHTVFNDKDIALVLIYWEDQQSYLAWKKSDVHLAGHKQPRPDYIIEAKSQTFPLL